MNAKFGPSGNSESFYNEGFKHTYQSPAWIAARGLDAYEYSAGNGITGGIATFQRIGEEAKKHSVLLSFHTPYYISLSGVDTEKRQKSIDYIAKSVAAAEAMGADTIVIHAGSASKISRAEAVYLAKDTMFKALEALPDTKVRFGIETMGKLNQLGTLEEVLEICSVSPRLCPVVDWGHMNARNVGGLFPTADDYRRVFDLIGKTIGYEYADTLHCHFSKIEYTAAGEKRHLTFDDTVYGPDFEPLMEAIVKDGYSPRILCESAGTQAEDALTMKKYYQSLL
ncbi:MAG: TIM barrel protein [Clostridia bacterium]|nr:TIM barrel protein [Clostridia bacterium]MBQ8382896.1 TIM barrel protein [Clostridia bacterium]